MIGAGKYDDLCTLVRQQAKALGALVIVLDGEHGNGFSVQADPHTVRNILPWILRQVADEIDNDARKEISDAKIIRTLAGSGAATRCASPPTRRLKKAPATLDHDGCW